MYSLIGYNEFGGHSKLDESDAFLPPNVRYQDEYNFRNIEAGFLGTYSISSLHIGIGAKVSYDFDIEKDIITKTIHRNKMDGKRTTILFSLLIGLKKLNDLTQTIDLAYVSRVVKLKKPRNQ